MSPKSFALRFFSTIAIAACFTYPASAQSSSPQAQATDLVLKRTVRRVIVDVVVTDSLSKPVSGLTEKDFNVKEDGRQQQIMTFDVHALEAPADSSKLPPLPPNTFLNLPVRAERGPLYVILYDLVNMELDDQPRARQQILKFIREKPSGTRFAIFVASDALRLVQGFTDDENQLYATLDPSSPKPHIPKIFLYGRNHGLGDPFFSASVLTDIAHYLEGLPGRKNLIWFSSRFPVRLFPQKDDSPDMREDMIETVSSLTRSQTAVYTIDAGGLSAENPHGPQAMSDTGRIQITDQGPSGSGGGVDTGAGASLIMTNQMGANDIASQTGGHAFYSTNDLLGAFNDALAMGGEYYSISYSPANQHYDGGLRKIQVELSQRGYQLSYRRSYYADDPELPSPHLKTTATTEDAPIRKQGDSLFANMQHGAPLAHQLMFRAHIYTAGSPALGTPEQMANLAEQPAYFRVRHKNKPVKPLSPIQLQTYAIDYTVIARQISSGASKNGSGLEIAVAAFDGEGRMLNGVVENAPAMPPTANPPGAQNNFLRAQQHIDVPLSATTIRLAVRDLATDRIGAMEIKLPLVAESSASAVVPESKQPSVAKPN